MLTQIYFNTLVTVYFRSIDHDVLLLQILEALNLRVKELEEETAEKELEKKQIEDKLKQNLVPMSLITALLLTRFSRA